MKLKGFHQRICRFTKRASFKSDLVAGLSVAAVALPVSIAYAQMAGFSPIVGVYSTILPMIVYAIFGSSRQMIIGPDAAVCALLMAALAPMVIAHDNPSNYHAMAVLLTFFTGVFCLIGWWFRLGFLANLLSRPILLGLLNGVAVIIMVGQLGKVIGVKIEGGGGVIGQVSSFMQVFLNPHWPTLMLSIGLALFYVLLNYIWHKGPVALLVAAIAIGLSMVFNFSAYGVADIGEVALTLPQIQWPEFSREVWGNIFASSIALAFMSFSGAALTARSFAAKNNYLVDDNRELLAIGVANIASALSQGFAVSGADSRTAVNDSAGGKTRMVQVYAALTILLIVILFIKPLAYLPAAALGVILMISAYRLADFKALLRIRKLSLSEFAISLITTLAVIVIGVMPGIFLAVMLALIHFLMRTARPVDYRLGVIDEKTHLYELEHYPEAQEVSGLLFYRFEASLIFFNANYFRKRVQHFIDTSKTLVRWVVLDISSMNEIDLTGLLTLSELSKSLAEQNIVFAITGRYKKITQWSQLHNVNIKELPVRFFRHRNDALSAYYAEMQAHEASADV